MAGRLFFALAQRMVWGGGFVDDTGVPSPMCGRRSHYIQRRTGHLPRWHDVMTFRGYDVYHAQINDDSFMHTVLTSDSLASNTGVRKHLNFHFGLGPLARVHCDDHPSRIPVDTPDSSTLSQS